MIIQFKRIECVGGIYADHMIVDQSGFIVIDLYDFCTRMGITEKAADENTSIFEWTNCENVRDD